MKESDIQTACLAFLRAKRIFCFRVNNTGVFDPTRKIFRRSPNTTKGLPDIIGILKIKHSEGTQSVPLPVVGQFIAIECKSKTGRLSEDQKRCHEDIVAAGGIVLVVRSVDELIEDLKELAL